MYDTYRVNRNIVLFADILCTFHSVVVKENIINIQIAIPTLEGLFGVTPKHIPGFIKHLIEAEEIAKRLTLEK